MRALGLVCPSQYHNVESALVGRFAYPRLCLFSALTITPAAAACEWSVVLRGYRPHMVVMLTGSFGRFCSRHS